MDIKRWLPPPFDGLWLILRGTIEAWDFRIPMPRHARYIRLIGGTVIGLLFGALVLGLTLYVLRR